MSEKWIVERFKHGSYQGRRTFPTRDQAVNYANDWSDDHSDESGWQLQIIAPNGRTEQLGVNGNDR